MGYGFRNTGYRRPSYEVWSGGGGRSGFRWFITPTIKALVVANAAVFLLTLIARQFSPGLLAGIYEYLGLVPGRFIYGFVWQPVTYLFLHAGFWHLFFNMFALWMFGMPLERDWGGRRFLRYYFLTGIGAGLFSVVVTWISVAAGYGAGTPYDELLIPTIGASGAIYGILLAFGLLYPSTPVYVMFLFPIPARLFVIIFGVITFVSALNQSGTGVSHVAHLGGMIIGLFYLRGPGGILFGFRKMYANWQLNRARRKFRVYVREAEERERRRTHPEDWIN